MKKIGFLMLLIFLMGCAFGGNSAPTSRPTAIERNARTVQDGNNETAEYANNNAIGETAVHVSTFETKLVDKQKNRLINLDLASQAINGTVLAPNEEFSFNNIVGPRTAERGYKKAYIFVGKEKEKGIGGGVCQISTTLYNAAMGAFFEITERHPHEKEVPYVAKGLDATVAYGSLDLKFVNTKSNPVRIDCQTLDGVVIVDIWEIV